MKIGGVTLINKETREFKTFTDNVWKQHMVISGKFYGLTYEVGKTEYYPDKECGNNVYIALRKAGWIKWQDFCRDKGLNIRDYGFYLI